MPVPATASAPTRAVGRRCSRAPSPRRPSPSTAPAVTRIGGANQPRAAASTSSRTTPSSVTAAPVQASTRAPESDASQARSERRAVLGRVGPDRRLRWTARVRATRVGRRAGVLRRARVLRSAGVRRRAGVLRCAGVRRRAGVRPDRVRRGARVLRRPGCCAAGCCAEPGCCTTGYGARPAECEGLADGAPAHPTGRGRSGCGDRSACSGSNRGTCGSSACNPSSSTPSSSRRRPSRPSSAAIVPTRSFCGASMRTGSRRATRR